MRHGRRGVTRAGVAIAMALCLMGGGFATAALHKANEQANRSKCSNHLRQLGFAALQHGDDRRFLPHVGPAEGLAGGVESNHATRTMRSLVNRGYLDGGDLFVCPSSSDEAVEPVMANPNKSWTWSALRGLPNVDPTEEGAPDPVLAETTELSYGWTRRRLSPNTRSTTPLSADRAVREADADPTDEPMQGNHLAGLNVLQADATVTWVAKDDPARERLTAIDDARDAGALGIWPVGQPRVLRARAWWQGAGLEALALVPLGLGGLVLLLRGEPRPQPPAARPRVAALASEDGAVQPAQRCPYCHDAVAESEAAALTRCGGCSAVFHAECVPDGGACTTLGCPGAAA